MSLSIACIIAIVGSGLMLAAIIAVLLEMRRQKKDREHQRFLDKNNGWML